MGPGSTSRTFPKALRITAVALLLVTALATRLHAPWQMGVINDEMIHITSYHPEYENQRFLTWFHQFLTSHGHVTDRSEILRIDELYNRSYLLQRLQYIFIKDAHPPLFDIFVELVNCVPGHKLLITRLSAVMASLLFSLLLYLAGREYAGQVLGLWVSGIATVSVIFRLYSGLARPYAFAQGLLALVLLSFLHHKRTQSVTLRPFLLVALLAQSTDWMLWPVIGPMIVVAGYERYRVTRSTKRIISESWWYALISCALLVLLGLQTRIPNVAKQLVEARGQWPDWQSLAVATPFAEWGNLFGPSITGIAAALFFVLCAIGLVKIAANPERPRPERYALAAAMLAGILVIFAVLPSSRYYIIPMTILTFSAGVAINMLLGGRELSELAFSAMMAIALVIFLVKPENPYAWFFPDDTPYSLVAQRLSAEMKPGDIWFSEPYYTANNLFLYGAPSPSVPVHDRYDAATLERCATVVNCYLLSRIDLDPRLQGALSSPSVKVFSFENDFVLFLYPHTQGRRPAAASE